MVVTPSWEARFGAFSVNSFDVARDRPNRVVVAAGGVEPHQLHAWDRVTGERRRLTEQPGGILGGAISADGRWVYYLDDPEASEQGRLVRVRWDGGAPEVVDPSLAPGYLLRFASHGSMTAFSIVQGERYEHRVASGDTPGSRFVASDEAASYGEAWVASFADAGRTLVVARNRLDGNREMVLYDVASGRETGKLSAPDHALIAYTPSPIRDDLRFLAESGETGRRRPFLWDRSSDARTLIAVDDLQGEVRALDWSPDGQLVLLLQIDRAETVLHVHDLGSGARRRLDTPSGMLTGLPVEFATVFASATEVLTLWQDGAHPRAVLAVPTDGRPPTIALGDADPPPGHRWRNVSFPTDDGTPIQAWLAVPPGDGPFPAVVDVHGGPGVAQFDEYLPMLQALVDAGFVVISINYRSSNTFGIEFERSIYGHPGELEVVDMVAAADYLVGEGLADPSRIVAEGWSYGGYLTLMALGRRPGRWAAGICGVGIGDMVAEHAEAAPMISQMFTGVFEGTPDEVPERYVAASPITYADAVAAPLLVIHGRDDIRCPPGQMQRYLDRMAVLGKDVTVEWFSAGHLGGVADPSLQLEHTRLMLAFLAQAVGTGPVPARG